MRPSDFTCRCLPGLTIHVLLPIVGLTALNAQFDCLICLAARNLRTSEVALNFKEQGNEYFVGKRPREALGFYTQGIEASPTDKKLLEVLYVNRAACNLALGSSPLTVPVAPAARRQSLRASG